MWYAPLGFLMSFFIGLGLSYCLNRIFKQQRVKVDHTLFFPIIGERIRRRNEGIFDDDENVVSKNEGAPKKYIFNINSANDAETSDYINTTKL